MSPEAIELRAALGSIALCALLLKEHDTLFKRFLDESTLMDSFGPIVDPSLWMNPERRKVDDSLRPLIEATRVWLTAVAEAQAVVSTFPGAPTVGDGAATTGA